MFRKRGKTEKPAGRSYRAELSARLRDWHGWLNLALLFAVLEVAVLSIEQARWIERLPSLKLTLGLAVLIVRALDVLRVHGLVIHIVALGAGAPVVMWQVDALRTDPAFYFAVFLAAVIWVTGYLSAWFALRRKNPWIGVALGGLVVLVNLSNLPMRYYMYFGFYFVAAVFFIVHTRLIKRRSAAERTARYTGRGLLYFVSSLVCIVLVAVAVSWFVPEVRFPGFQTMVASKILWKQDLEKSSFNFFAPVPSKQSLYTNSMRLNLPFGATWHAGDRIDFIVKAGRPSYWQVRAYDVYTAAGWENGPVTDFALKSKARWEDAAPPANGETVTYAVTPKIRTDALLTSGSFLAASKPALVQAGAGGAIGVMAQHILSAGESYTVTASVAQAAPAQLDAAGENYTQVILDSYLQLPPGFPGRVRDLSERVTANATTPYQKVLMINEYLSGIPYSMDIEAPPGGKDGVEHFLFVEKTGFCVHFASAMAVMLRSVDVPARLAIGYLPGDPGEEQGEYILRDRYYHAWPQVYFPGYGWVDIEATPSSSEGAGASEVDLTEPVVSGETIRDLPQWEVWVYPGLYGFDTGQGGGGSAVSSSGSVTKQPGPWAFAAPLGQALLIVLVIGFFLALGAVPFLALRSSFYRWVWRVDRVNLAAATYERMCRLGAMIRLGPMPQQTPLEYSAALEAEFPEHANELREITQAYLERKFGGRAGKPGLFEEAKILKARRAVFEKFMGRLGRLEKVFRGRL